MKRGGRIPVDIIRNISVAVSTENYFISCQLLNDVNRS